MRHCTVPLVPTSRFKIRQSSVGSVLEIKLLNVGLFSYERDAYACRIRSTVMRRLKTGILLRNALLGSSVAVRTLQSVLAQTQIVYYSLLRTKSIRYSLLLLGYKPVQLVTVLNTVDNCKTMVL